MNALVASANGISSSKGSLEVAVLVLAIICLFVWLVFHLRRG